MALFGLISGLLAYKISKPILSLSREVMDFKGGKFCRINSSSRIYEIDVLCTQFNHMTEEIHKLIESLLKQEKLKQRNWKSFRRRLTHISCIIRWKQSTGWR